jgi:membrane associated rhomboid family serine protease
MIHGKTENSVLKNCMFFRHSFPILSAKKLVTIHARPNLKCQFYTESFGQRHLVRSALLKGFCFTTTATLTLFTFLSIIDYEKRHLQQTFSHSYKRIIFGRDDDNVSERLFSRLYRRWHDYMKRWKKESHYGHSWESFTQNECTIFSLIAANGVIFLLWKIPRLVPFMHRYFSLHLGLQAGDSFKPIRLLLSSFSHYSGMHFGLNMVGLYTFGLSMHDALGGREHFLFVYLSSCILSSYLTFLYQMLIKKNLYYSSLGASGGVCSLLGITAHFPHVRIALIFLPFISVSAPIAVAGLIAFDLHGLIFRHATSSIDHMAHLAGVALGYSYWYWGRQNIWKKRDVFLKKIHYI